MKPLKCKMIFCVSICIFLFNSCVISTENNNNTENIATVDKYVETIVGITKVTDANVESNCISFSETNKKYDGYWYEDIFCSSYPIFVDNHRHDDYLDIKYSTRELIVKKLVDAQKIYNILIGNVSRKSINVTNEEHHPISDEYGTVDDIRKLCSNTFSHDVRDFGTSFSSKAPEEFYWIDENYSLDTPTIHEYLDKYIKTHTFDGEFCPRDYFATQPIKYYTEIADVNIINDLCIECTLCTALGCEKESDDKTKVIIKTIYTHSKMRMEKLNDQWYITTLEFPIAELKF